MHALTYERGIEQKERKKTEKTGHFSPIATEV
jgi:hypothetical protein